MDNLEKFISEERTYFELLNTGIKWEDEKWDARSWLFHRGKDVELLFTTQARALKMPPQGIVFPSKGSLPLPFFDFVKALAVYLQRTKGVGFMAIRSYVNECRRLHIIMSMRTENSPAQLTRWHFERTVNFLKEIQYKNIYDAAANLQVISEIIDKKGLSNSRIDFKHGLMANHKYHAYVPVSDIDDDQKRKDEEKLPSLEAMAAYATCTNSPINADEEILLRTTDLLIAMGQRGNEVALLPYDCWVEKAVKDKLGNEIHDAYGNPILSIGIRYYAEKQFQSRVHWLAEQDVPLARRAVERLKILTEEVRKIAKFQEDNPGRLWKFAPDQIVPDDELLEYLGFISVYNLSLYLTERNNIQPVGIGENKNRPTTLTSSGKQRKNYTRQNLYRAGDIERLLVPKLDHVALKEKVGGKWKTILKTSDVLSIRFDGAFRFKRGANTFKVLPGRVTLVDINSAFGSVPGKESIFERRNLTEADGTKIVLTSHVPRHWRNTLYELAGMSNVQQALAMGRQKLDQNATYQHTSLAERTQFHKEFLSFMSPTDKIRFLHDGIKEKKILGHITDTYHSLKENNSPEKAESFLKTHALAIHLTPFGGCTHDFSQSPCLKHLQCWNGCSHLHRTNTPGETERLQEQLELSKNALKTMMDGSDNEYGSDKWIDDLRQKVSNLEKALVMKIDKTSLPVFKDGIPFTRAIHENKSSSVK